jgi:hypothetical protein
MNTNDLLWLFCKCLGIYFLAYSAMGLVIVLQAPALGSAQAFWMGITQTGFQGVIGFYLAFHGRKLLQMCATSFRPGDEDASAS